MLTEKKKIPFKHLIIYGLLPSSFKVFIYKLRGYRIGQNVSIGFGSIIIGEDVKIEDNTKIGFLTIIRSKQINIGRYVNVGSFVYIDTENLEIGEDSEIREYVYVAGLKTPESRLKLGKRCGIFQYCFINPTKPIVLGDDCGIGGLSQLFTHGSYLSKLEGYPVAFAPITIGNNVWIPWDVFILPGVTIGNNVVIGAGSIINKDIPSNCIAAGNPAKVVKENFPATPSKEVQKSILKKILSEFRNHLEHNGFTWTETQLQDGISIIFHKKNKHQLIFTNNFSELPTLVEDTILIIGNDDKPINDIYIKSELGMIISLARKERIGNSFIGEEFYRFLSRYGIRCDRLD